MSNFWARVLGREGAEPTTAGTVGQEGVALRSKRRLLPGGKGERPVWVRESLEFSHKAEARLDFFNYGNIGLLLHCDLLRIYVCNDWKKCSNCKSQTYSPSFLLCFVPLFLDQKV